MSRELAAAADAGTMQDAPEHCRSAVVSSEDAWIAPDVAIMSQLQRILEVTRKYFQLEPASRSAK